MMRKYTKKQQARLVQVLKYRRVGIVSHVRRVRSGIRQKALFGDRGTQKTDRRDQERVCVGKLPRAKNISVWSFSKSGIAEGNHCPHNSAIQSFIHS